MSTTKRDIECMNLGDLKKFLVGKEKHDELEKATKYGMTGLKDRLKTMALNLVGKIEAEESGGKVEEMEESHSLTAEESGGKVEEWEEVPLCKSYSLTDESSVSKTKDPAVRVFWDYSHNVRYTFRTSQHFGNNAMNKMKTFLKETLLKDKEKKIDFSCRIYLESWSKAHPMTHLRKKYFGKGGNSADFIQCPLSKLEMDGSPGLRLDVQKKIHIDMMNFAYTYRTRNPTVVLIADMHEKNEDYFHTLNRLRTLRVKTMLICPRTWQRKDETHSYSSRTQIFMKCSVDYLKMMDEMFHPGYCVKKITRQSPSDDDEWEKRVQVIEPQLVEMLATMKTELQISRVERYKLDKSDDSTLVASKELDKRAMKGVHEIGIFWDEENIPLFEQHGDFKLVRDLFSSNPPVDNDQIRTELQKFQRCRIIEQRIYKDVSKGEGSSERWRTIARQRNVVERLMGWTIVDCPSYAKETCDIHMIVDMLHFAWMCKIHAIIPVILIGSGDNDFKYVIRFLKEKMGVKIVAITSEHERVVSLEGGGREVQHKVVVNKDISNNAEMVLVWKARYDSYKIVDDKIVRRGKRQKTKLGVYKAPHGTSRRTRVVSRSSAS